VRPSTFTERRRIYLLARVLVARHYRRELTVGSVASALSCSSRQLQRAYAQFGELTFRQDLAERRMVAAAELLTQQAIPLCDVARLVGYSHRPYFARAFTARYGISPARFRERERVIQCLARRGLLAGDVSGSISSTSGSARGR
jgi:AraC family transcriptional regulator of adaptative response / methylphosphotriester-DNA alkyltransferase methyltransferase